MDKSVEINIIELTIEALPTPRQCREQLCNISYNDVYKNEIQLVFKLS